MRVKSGIVVMGDLPAPLRRLRADRVLSRVAIASPPAKMKSSIRRSQGLLGGARTPGEAEVLQSRRLDRLGAGLGHGGVGRVVAAEARDLGAGRPKAFHRVLGRRRSFAIIDRLDAAGFEPFADEGDAAAMGGLGTEGDEIGLRSRAGLAQIGVRPVAQGFERLGDPHRRERAGQRGRMFPLRGARRDLRGRLVEMGVGADAGDRRLESCRVALQRRGAFADFTLERAVRQRGRQAAPALDTLEEKPSLVDQRPGQGLEPAGPRRRIGDEAEIGFAQKHQLAVTREPPREAVRQADGERMRQDARRCRGR